MQVVAVQLDIAWEDREASHARVRRLLKTVEVAPGALIVLPEMFDVGFSMNLEKTAQDASRASEAFLRELAAEYDAAALGGVVGPISNGKGTNEAVAFAPDGQELVRYVKMQPFTLGNEHLKYAAGERHRVFSWGGMQIAPFICYDLRFPELFRPAVSAGAEAFVVIASWPHMRSEHWVRLLQARAIENLAYVVGVNRCGSDPKFQYDGRTAAFDPHGKTLFENGPAEQATVCVWDPEEVRDWRRKFPALGDMRSAGGSCR